MTHRCNEPEPGRLLTSWPSAGCRAITAWNSPNPTAPPTPSLFGPNPTLTRPPTPRGRVGRSGHHFFEQGGDEVSALLEKIEARRADLWRPSRRLRSSGHVTARKNRGSTCRLQAAEPPSAEQRPMSQPFNASCASHVLWSCAVLEGATVQPPVLGCLDPLRGGLGRSDHGCVRVRARRDAA